MTLPQKTVESNWKKQFDANFTSKNKKMPRDEDMLWEKSSGKIKDFITSLLSEIRSQIEAGKDNTPNLHSTKSAVAKSHAFNTAKDSDIAILDSYL